MNNTTELKDVSSRTLAEEAVKLLLEKKAEDVRLYSVADVTSVTDYYINATGRSKSQVAALADEIAEKLGERGRDALRVEGRRGDTWILVDYADVILNVFDRETRSFYDLDRLFGEDTLVDISALEAEVDKKFDINTKD